MEQKITISVDEYKKLLLNSNKLNILELNILECDGVDDWCGYMERSTDWIRNSFIELFPKLIPYDSFINILELKDIVNLEVYKKINPKLTDKELLTRVGLLEQYIETIMEEGTGKEVMILREVLNV